MKPQEPIGRFDSASGLWVQTEEHWTCDLSGDRTLIVTAGATSDGASVPLNTPFSPRYESRSFTPAYTHDQLYAAELLPRAECDREFLRLMRVFGVPEWQSLAYYIAVRVFGWSVWRKHTPDSIRTARRHAEIVDTNARVSAIKLQQIWANA